MKDEDVYFAAVVQPVRNCVNHRKEIKEKNLKRACTLIDWAAKMGGRVTRTRLIAFPEVFLQGWLGQATGWQVTAEKYVNDIAVEIPGEETDILGEKAIEHDVFIAAGTMHEVDPKWPDRFFNTACIIGPDGKIILKYRKINPYPTWELGISPHDMYDEYVKEYGDNLKTFFPVADTVIGKLGILVCYDGEFPEIARGLALQGAEVIIRPSGIIESFARDSWEITNRAIAYTNKVYTLASGPGATVREQFPLYYCPGHSMVVDFNGRLLCHADYPGETVAGATISLETLRKHRMEHDNNHLTQLRTEIFRKIYEKTIFPANKFIQKPPKTTEERKQLQPIDKFIKKGIYKLPKDMKSN
jgi:predicted amidohydrolase